MDRYLLYLATPYSAGAGDDGAFVLQKDAHIEDDIGRGLTHCTRNLEAFIKEAVMLDRIAILLPPILRPSHNLNYRIESSWKCYYDLDKISIYVRYDGLAARFFKHRVIAGGISSTLNMMRRDN